jgi:hypothetical protein
MAKLYVARFVAVAFLAFGFVAASSFASTERAHAQGQQGVASVEVDVSELRTRGLGEFAELIGESVRRELRRHYPTAPSGARLVVSLETITFTGDPMGGGFDAFGFGGFEPSDYLSGTNYLVGRDGRVIDTYPLTASSPARRAGPTHLPLERERAVILGQVYAQWVARRF